MLRDLTDRLRESLFFVPATFIVVSGAAAFGALQLDALVPTEGREWLLSTTVDSARSILSTVATATVTVAAIVFSMTAVVVQLATSQFSPRVTQGFLRDRYQQVTIGITIGTFVFCLIVLATVRGSSEEDVAGHDVSVTLAVVLGVVSMLAIVSFIDRIMRSMRVDTIIRRLADRIETAIDDMPHPEPSPQVGADRTLGTERLIEMSESGWVTEIDVDAILAAIPADTSVRIDVEIGGYAHENQRVATAWGEIEEAAAHDIRSAIEVSRLRAISSDPAYGFRQLVDIALRALSPSLNDPTTGADVVRHLVGPVRSVMLRDLPSRVSSSEGGRRVYRPFALTHSDYVRLAFQEIRMNSTDQPHVLGTLLVALSGLIDVVEAGGVEGRAAPLVEETRAVLDVVGASSFSDDEQERLRALAHRSACGD